MRNPQTKQKKSSKPKQRSRKQTPFADTGGILGNAIGTMFNAPSIGRNVGRWLGTGIGSIFGSGDYTMVGPQPTNNVLTNGAQIPKFTTGRNTSIISHREYLRDITGTTPFTVQAFALNPGVSNTFPWLANIAQGYQEYRFLGCIFEFRSLITDFVTSGSPGVVVLSTNYNADAPLFDTKQEMENAEYSVAVKPTVNLIHGIECDSRQTILPSKYVRSGVLPLGQDYKNYDLGNFQIATQGNPNQLLGELWVSYVVEFAKPILPRDVFGVAVGAHIQRTAISTANPLGTAVLQTKGSLPATSYSNGFTFFGQPGNEYTISVIWTWSTAVSATTPAVTVTTGLAYYTTPQYANGTNSVATGTGFFSTTMVFQAIYKCIATSPSTCVIEFATIGGAFGASASVDIIIENSDSSV